MIPIRSSARWIRRAVGAAAAALGVGILGILTWPESAVDPCPAPPGLQDLEFVRIDPGVVDLEDRSILVEKAFCIGTKEVSRRDWQEVMGTALRRPEWPLDWPITYVTLDDVEQFLGRLETRDPGVDYSLPTAAQWEYAARAGQTMDYFFGDDEAQLHRYGNCRNLLGQDGHEGPAPVGSYEANSWGLYDVHGNAAEWVLWPTDEGPEIGDGGKRQALRLGGSFQSVPHNCTFSSSRNTVDADARTRGETGFRVVRRLP